VRDVAVHREVLELVISWAVNHDLSVGGCTVSPITGSEGNREFLALLRTGAPGMRIDDAVAACLDGIAVEGETRC
jgi:23S rRNA (cytidine1920-2'-O)/16S rRNA (cytidine1409-2'-O)-methyltransferase